MIVFRSILRGFLPLPFSALVLLACAPAFAQYSQVHPGPGHNAVAPPSNAAAGFLQNVGIDQKLGAQVSPDLVFRDETGKEVKLGDYYGKRPIILALVYFDCPMLCTVVLNELTRTLRGLSLNVGESFEVLTVSFDPRETPQLAAEKKASYLKQYGRPGAADGWHFLTGDQESIRQLTSTVGFRYTWDEKQKQFIHSSGLIILTPQGRVSRYFYGIDYAPTDVKFALQEASGNQIGSVAERVLVYCYRFDPRTGKYGLVIGRALQIGGAVTVLGLGGFILLMLRRDRRRVYAQPRNVAATDGMAPPQPPASGSGTGGGGEREDTAGG